MKSSDALKGGTRVDQTRGLLDLERPKGDQPVKRTQVGLDQLPDARQFEGTTAPSVDQKKKADGSFIGVQKPQRKRAGRTRAWNIPTLADHMAVLRRPMVRQEYRQILNEDAMAGFLAVTNADANDPALRQTADQLLEQLLPAMKAARTPKAEQAIAALKKTGLDLLLVKSLGAGRVPLKSVDDELARLRSALVDRSLTANDIKDGIRAFDGEAQRLSLASGKNGRFHYHGEKNRARDSLITFGRSLHR